MKTIALLTTAATAATIFTYALLSVPGGRKAYFEQVRPIVAQYHDALTYGEDD